MPSDTACMVLHSLSKMGVAGPVSAMDNSHCISHLIGCNVSGWVTPRLLLPEGFWRGYQQVDLALDGRWMV